MSIYVEEELKKLYDKIDFEIEKKREAKVNEIMQSLFQELSQYSDSNKAEYINNKDTFSPRKMNKNKYAFVAYLSTVLLGVMSYGIGCKVNQRGFYQEMCFGQSNYDITQMLYNILENNIGIDSRYLENMKKLEKFLVQTSTLDYQLLAEKFTTLRIKNSNKVVSLGNSIILADYDMNQNLITIYPNAGGSEREIPHEFLHVIGYLSGYHYLNEGISELLNAEYCKNGYSGVYWQNVHCIKILCEFISPKVILEAYCSYDATPIIDSLTNLCRNKNTAESLLREMDSYCEKDMLDTISQKDFYELKSKVLTFLLLTYKNKPIDHGYEQIKQYLDLMAYPNINRDEEPILYFNQIEYSILESSKETTKKIKKNLKYE